MTKGLAIEIRFPVEVLMFLELQVSNDSEDHTFSFSGLRANIYWCKESDSRVKRPSPP
jgi:hypothetical protein